MKKLPPTIAAYVEESNARELDTLAARFTPDATVEDEGRTYRGLDDVRGWIQKTHEAYQFTLRVMDFAEEGGKTIVSCEVSGGFPGSPVQLRFFFTLRGDKIEELSIRE